MKKWLLVLLVILFITAGIIASYPVYDVLFLTAPEKMFSRADEWGNKFPFSAYLFAGFIHGSMLLLMTLRREG